MKNLKLMALGLWALVMAGTGPALASEMSVTEFANVGNAGANHESQIGVAQTPPTVDQTPVSFAGGVASSAAFNAASRYVRLLCDVQCSVAFGSNPTATTNNMVLPAGLPEYFSIVAGQKVSVIANPGF